MCVLRSRGETHNLKEHVSVSFSQSMCMSSLHMTPRAISESHFVASAPASTKAVPFRVIRNTVQKILPMIYDVVECIELLLELLQLFFAFAYLADLGHLGSFQHDDVYTLACRRGGFDDIFDNQRGHDLELG
jgi:hypothetical protein